MDGWRKKLMSLSHEHVPDRRTANEARLLIAQNKTAIPHISLITYQLETGIEPTT